MVIMVYLGLLIPCAYYPKGAIRAHKLEIRESIYLQADINNYVPQYTKYEVVVVDSLITQTRINR